MTESSDYRIELPQFSGPLELLLHLLDQEELDVGSISVARVCDRYLEHLNAMPRIDIDAAGEFLVMATTLLRLKAQSLLPEEERVLEDEDLDPRFELVRQLIEYRRFKRAAEKLDELREAYQQRFGRGMHPEIRERPDPAEAPVDAGGTTLEQLFAAFARLLRETERPTGWVIARDDTPMSAHVERLERELTPGRRLTLGELVGERRTRAWIVGVFLALLEMIKRGIVVAEQDGDFGEVRILVREARLEDAPAPPTRAPVNPAPPPQRAAPVSADPDGAPGSPPPSP